MRLLTLIVQGFLALNAMAGGYLLMLAPDGGLLQLPPTFMHSKIFSSYFWPGAVLFSIIGVGHLLGFLLTLRRSAQAARVAFVLGCGTLIWILVQVLLTDLFWLQALIAALGVLELVGARGLVQRR